MNFVTIIKFKNGSSWDEDHSSLENAINHLKNLWRDDELNNENEIITIIIIPLKKKMSL